MFAYTAGLSLSSGSPVAGILEMAKSAAPSVDDGQKSALDELNLSTNTNLAMAYIKVNNADKAVYFANKVSPRPAVLPHSSTPRLLLADTPPVCARLGCMYAGCVCEGFVAAG